MGGSQKFSALAAARAWEFLTFRTGASLGPPSWHRWRIEGGSWFDARARALVLHAIVYGEPCEHDAQPFDGARS